MTKLNNVLCVVLFCGLSVALPPVPVPGGFHEATPEVLTDLHPILEKALIDYSVSHTDFDGRLKRIVSGKSQVVAGTNYDLIIELENSEKQTSEWNAQVSQGVDRKLVEVVLTIPGKQIVLRPSESERRKRSPQGLGGFGAPSKASDKVLADLYPSLEQALLDYGKAHSEFGLTLKSIESGDSQVVAGTIYNLIVKVENAEKEVSEWSANVVENLQGKIVEVKLTAPGKEHHLTFA